MWISYALFGLLTIFVFALDSDRAASITPTVAVMPATQGAEDTVGNQPDVGSQVAIMPATQDDLDAPLITLAPMPEPVVAVHGSRPAAVNHRPRAVRADRLRPSFARTTEHPRDSRGISDGIAE